MVKRLSGYKAMAWVVALLIILSFSGCTARDSSNSGTTAAATTAAATTTSAPAATTEKSTLISPERLVIKAWATERVDCPINNDMPVLKALIEKTNIEFDWELVPVASEEEKFNLMMSTGIEADVIFFSDDKMIPYAEAGMYEPLKGLILEHAPNLKKYLIDDANVRREIAFDNGEIYYVTRTTSAAVSGGFMIREDWLKKLNLPMPVTVDDWYSTMVAFKNGNLNNNKVIWPFTARKASDITVDRLKHFMGAWGIDLLWYVDNGAMKLGVYEPAAKDAFSWLSKLYVEGLLDADIFTNNASAWEARIANEISGWTYDSRGRGDTFTVMLKEVNPEAQFVGVAPPKGPAGVMSFDKNTATDRRSAAINKDSKHKVEIIKFLDYCYSEEGLTLNNFGLEGVHYTELTKDKVTFTDLILKDPQKRSPGIALMNQGIDGNIPFPYDKRLEMGYRSRGSVSIIEAMLPILRDPYPEESMKYTDSERDTYNSKWLDMHTYMDEMLTKFVMGLEPMDNWDKFIQKLKEMGVEEVIKIQNDVYKRYLTK